MHWLLIYLCQKKDPWSDKHSSRFISNNLKILCTYIGIFYIFAKLDRAVKMVCINDISNRKSFEHVLMFFKERCTILFAYRHYTSSSRVFPNIKCMTVETYTVHICHTMYILWGRCCVRYSQCLYKDREREEKEKNKKKKRTCVLGCIKFPFPYSAVCIQM